MAVQVRRTVLKIYSPRVYIGEMMKWWYENSCVFIIPHVGIKHLSYYEI